MPTGLARGVMGWGGQAVLGLLGGLVVWALWRAGRPPGAFTVRVAGGEARVSSGRATAAFVAQVGKVAAEHGVRSGQVRGVPRGDGSIGLEFSRGFPPPARQRLRNWWGLDGWRAPGRRG